MGDRAEHGVRWISDGCIVVRCSTAPGSTAATFESWQVDGETVKSCAHCGAPLTVLLEVE